MMTFIPILFFCLNGSCGMATTKTSFESIEECSHHAMAMRNELEERKATEIFARCVAVEMNCGRRYQTIHRRFDQTL